MSKASFYDNKKVLVTGGTGMIGRELIALLQRQGAILTVASLDEPTDLASDLIFKRVDLRHFDQCQEVCAGQDIVFNLVGVKGSPAMTSQKPASFFVPTIMLSLNMMEAARAQGVDRYLYTSSIGVYEPAEVFNEDDVWKTFPSPNDRFAGWAKRMGELQAQAYEVQHGWNKVSIVRPANVYGAFDNFDPENAMVIPSLIYRALNESGPLTVWGDGTPIRDFIHAKDVALGMLTLIEKGYNKPVNLGSGTGVTIREIAELVAHYCNVEELIWDTTKPKGDNMRIMNVQRAKSLGITSTVSLSDGIKETVDWYKKNRQQHIERYNAFTDKQYQRKG